LLDASTATVQQFDSKRDGFGLMRRMKLGSKMSVDANQRPLRAVQNRKVVGLYRETNGALRIARVLYLCMAQSP